MIAKKIFFNILKEEFAPRFSDIGFKGSGQNFRRLNGEIINTINIQGHKYGGSCAVNLGLYLSFLPVNWSDQLPDVRTIKEVDCEFRKRLAPKNKGDYWWKYKGLFDSPERKARHLIETYFNYGEIYFKKYDTVEKIASMISLEDVERKNYIKVFGGIARQHVALAMARIHKHLGNISEANVFAKSGLNNTAQAVKLKSAFEKILNLT